MYKLYGGRLFNRGFPYVGLSRSEEIKMSEVKAPTAIITNLSGALMLINRMV